MVSGPFLLLLELSVSVSYASANCA